MMTVNVICFVVTVLAVTSSVRSYRPAGNNREDLDAKWTYMKNLAQDKGAIAVAEDKVENICPGAGYKVESVVEKVQDCIDGIDEQNNTLCSIVQNDLEKCFSPVISLFEACLPEKSKDLPRFLVASIKDTVAYLCKTDGEHIFELYHPCVRQESYPLKRCTRKMQTKMEQYAKSMPSVEDICSLAMSMRGCWASHVQASCGSPKTREAVLDVYDASTAACKNLQPREESLNEVDVEIVLPKKDIEWINTEYNTETDRF